MSLVSAKCPSCGAALKVPDDKDYVVCEFCDSSVRVREAVRLYTEADIPDWFILADSALKNKKYPEALHYYMKILETDAKQSGAWLGRAAVTAEMMILGMDGPKAFGNISSSGTQIIQGFGGTTQIITTTSKPTKTVYLRKPGGGFKDLGTIFGEIGKALSTDNYSDPVFIAATFSSYSTYLDDISSFIENAFQFAKPEEVDGLNERAGVLAYTVVEKMYNKLKSSYKDSYLPAERVFTSYLDFTGRYIEILEKALERNPGYNEIKKLLYTISNENVITAEGFIAVPGAYDPKLLEYRDEMLKKKEKYYNEI